MRIYLRIMLIMRRKPGEIIPIERSILLAASRMRGRGIEQFHGFRIAKEIKDQDGARRLTAHGTLYRALARLERQGYLTSHWEDPLVAAKENRPRRKFYTLTGKEAGVLAEQVDLGVRAESSSLEVAT